MKQLSKTKGKSFKLKIEKLVYGGKGLGRLNGKTVFVPSTAPGDLVIAEEVTNKSGYIEAKLVKVLKEGKGRVKPKCPHFGKCGGCDWQHLSYETQVEAKRLIVEENLQRIGKIKKPRISEVIPSPSPWNYRNRVQIKVKNGKVGFFAKNSRNLVEVNSCPLLKEELQDIFPKLKESLSLFPIPPSEFHLYSSSKGEVLLKVVFANKVNLQEIKEIKLSLECIKKTLNVNLIGFGLYRRDKSENFERVSFFGRDFTYEIIGKFKYRVSADSFFQVNRFQVHNLIDRVSKVAMASQYMLAGDLYCGVGTFTIPVGRYVHRAFGIESNFWAISDALYNKDLNGLRNVQFFCRETEEGLDIVKNYSPDLVVFDPPRSGLNGRIVKEIANLPKLKKIVYVSCNPSTLARDIALFYKFGVHLEEVKVLDMFPQTYHVETIAILRKVR